jgi:hypothetical protein
MDGFGFLLWLCVWMYVYGLCVWVMCLGMCLGYVYGYRVSILREAWFNKYRGLPLLGAHFQLYWDLLLHETHFIKIWDLLLLEAQLNDSPNFSNCSDKNGKICPSMQCQTNFSSCHNPIFSHGILSGVGAQNGTGRTEPA